MTPTIRLALIDDHPLFREGVARTLSEIGGFQVIGEGSTRDDALRIAAEKRPDIMLMDISMPGGGLNAIAPILQQNPQQRIVLLTVSEARDDVISALQSGAKGYVLKGVGSRALADILRTVAAGENYVSPALSARLLSNLSALTAEKPVTDLVGELSERERAILELVAAGLEQQAHRAEARSAREDRQAPPDPHLCQAQGDQPHRGGHGACATPPTAAARGFRTPERQPRMPRSLVRSAPVAGRLTMVRPRESFIS